MAISSKVDIPQLATEKPKGRYVVIPETDLFDQPHPVIRINDQSWGPGTHFIDEKYAGTVEDRVKTLMKANVRILQPKRDSESEGIMSMGRGSGSGAGVPTTNF